jgi:hypothetical protein
MGWVDNLITFRHNIFIVFIECKFDERGNWHRKDSPQTKTGYEVVTTYDNSEHNIIQLIEPDGLRRTFLVSEHATVSINQNVFSYQAGRLQEIAIDEKEQAGKGKSRDILQ